VAASFAGFINLILDPILMFPLKMGMMGAAAATALSQYAATGVYGWRMVRRGMLPQTTTKDTVTTTVISVPHVVKAILGANLAMLAKQGSLLVFYTYATALATRLGPAHVATHQVALSFFWLVTYVTDSGSVSGQVLMSQSMSSSSSSPDPIKVRSLTRYMIQYAIAQGLVVSALVASLARVVATVFTQDPTIRALLLQIMPYMAMQQTLVSLCLVLEGLAIGGNQFRFMASGTVVATCFAMRQLARATSAVEIWSNAVTVFFSIRLLNAIIGVMRVHWKLRRKNNEQSQQPFEPTPI
jgi:Na+-driven multidrug efflux pump